MKKGTRRKIVISITPNEQTIGDLLEALGDTLLQNFNETACKIIIERVQRGRKPPKATP